MHLESLNTKHASIQKWKTAHTLALTFWFDIDEATYRLPRPLPAVPRHDHDPSHNERMRVAKAESVAQEMLPFQWTDYNHNGYGGTDDVSGTDASNI